MLKSKCDKIIPFLDGFYMLLVYLKILCKRYVYIGLQDWFIDVATIWDGSILHLAVGKHYAREVRMQRNGLISTSYSTSE